MDAAGPIPTIEELEAEKADNQDAGFKDDAAAETGTSATPAVCSNLSQPGSQMAHPSRYI